MFYLVSFCMQLFFQASLTHYNYNYRYFHFMIWKWSTLSMCLSIMSRPKQSNVCTHVYSIPKIPNLYLIKVYYMALSCKVRTINTAQVLEVLFVRLYKVCLSIRFMYRYNNYWKVIPNIHQLCVYFFHNYLYFVLLKRTLTVVIVDVV